MSKVLAWLRGSSQWNWQDQSCDRLLLVVFIVFLLLIAASYAVPVLVKLVQIRRKRRRVHGNLGNCYFYGRRVR
jgi:hypothetical protein